MQCLEDQKVESATFLLQKEAEDWWRLVENKRGDKNTPYWEEFKKVFQEKYYPKSFYDAKRNEFLRLVQGSMTVVEYKKKYTELSKYALPIIANEADCCKRSEEGLRREIRTPVTTSAE